MQFANHRQGLSRERHDVRRTTQLFLLGALHSCSGNAPHRGVEIELGPLGLSQLARTDEHQERELKRRSRDRRALVTFDRTQQLADSLRPCAARALVSVRHGDRALDPFLLARLRSRTGKPGHTPAVRDALFQSHRTLQLVAWPEATAAP